MSELSSDLKLGISARRPFAESYFGKDYNSIKQQFGRAKEFADVAEKEFMQGRWPTFMENAQAAAELLAKTEMIFVGHLKPKDCDRISHSDIIKEYTGCVQKQKVTRELLDILVDLKDKRHEARYPNRRANVDDASASRSINVIRRKAAYLEKQMKKSV